MRRRTGHAAAEVSTDPEGLDDLLRGKADALGRMCASPEYAWPALMMHYADRCRAAPVPVGTIAILLTDLASQAVALAVRRTLAIDDRMPRLTAKTRGGRDAVCDGFERYVTEVFGALERSEGAPWELPRVAAYLEEACAMRLGTRQLAARTGWKPLPLVRAFMRHTDMTVREYLRRVRIRKATELLTAGEKVEWVAQQVGYRNRTHFNREFRRIVGCAPGAIKRQSADGSSRRSADRADRPALEHEPAR